MSSAGRCIARSTSSGMVVGPGIARNSRPARTTISCSFLDMLWEGMQGNDGKFKPQHDDSRLKLGASLFPQRLGDRSPDLILDLGRGRIGDDRGGTGALLAGLDQAQNPDLALGVIKIAAAVMPRHRRPDAGHLVF